MEFLSFNQYNQMLSEGSSGEVTTKRRNLAALRKTLRSHGLPVTQKTTHPEMVDMIRQLPKVDRVAIAIKHAQSPESRKIDALLPRFRARQTDFSNRVFAGIDRLRTNPNVSQDTKDQSFHDEDTGTPQVLAKYALAKRPGPRVPSGGTIPQSAELQQKIAANRRARGLGESDK